MEQKPTVSSHVHQQTKGTTVTCMHPSFFVMVVNHECTCVCVSRVCVCVCVCVCVRASVLCV